MNAKARDQSKSWLNSSRPIADRVTEWLGTKGFPSEFRAASTLEEAGFDTAQGMYVPGDDPHNPLEVDVLAHMWSEQGAAFELMVDCKFAEPSRCAYVAMVAARQEEFDALDSYATSDLVGHVLKTDSGQALVGSLRESLKRPHPAAFALRAMTTRSDDPGYDALNRLMGRVRARQGRLTNALVAGIVVPVLVIEGELAVARWNSQSAAFEVHSTDEVRVSWLGHSRWDRPSFLVDVVTMRGLEALAKRLACIGREWLGAVGPHVAEARKAEESRIFQEMWNKATRANLERD